MRDDKRTIANLEVPIFVSVVFFEVLEHVLYFGCQLLAIIIVAHLDNWEFLPSNLRFKQHNTSTYGILKCSKEKHQDTMCASF